MQPPRPIPPSSLHSRAHLGHTGTDHVEFRRPVRIMRVAPAAKLGNIVSGAFSPVLAKHSKNFSLIDAISVGVDRMQRNFEPMRRQIAVAPDDPQLIFAAGGVALARSRDGGANWSEVLQVPIGSSLLTRECRLTGNLRTECEVALKRR